ncbi:unnamed protein product [Allacma fusca]|uniref:Uncharacterized protein n=1 Tax=Allacma fusca TaxID=39272 RepID=A0A8J2J5C2_9HEXA|nr:unnamed protein product [Allacma fusca]
MDNRYKSVDISVLKTDLGKKLIKRDRVKILQQLKQAKFVPGLGGKRKPLSRKLREKARSAAFYANIHRLLRPSVNTEAFNEPDCEYQEEVAIRPECGNRSLLVDGSTIGDIALDPAVRISTHIVGNVKEVVLSTERSVSIIEYDVCEDKGNARISQERSRNNRGHNNTITQINWNTSVTLKLYFSVSDNCNVNESWL